MAKIRPFISKITMFNYFKEVRAEMKHVSWPTRRQAVVYTVVVIAVSLVTAVYLGLLDYVFSLVIKKII
jgi:preprotein translocase subunit SecE